MENMGAGERTRSKENSPGTFEIQLSSSLSELKSHYEVLIIGSGYGGSVAASRLSQSGKQVCVLEKGKEIPLGKFPRTPAEIFKASRFELKHGVFGPSAGLYRFNGEENYYLGVSSGLGGGL